MNVTRKGRVTIPQAIRERARMPPGAEGERLGGGASGGVGAAGQGRGWLSTEEIMALTRG